jgi:hypothetical protein
MEMKIKIVLAAVVCLLFISGLSQLKECAGGEGAEIQDFRKNVDEFKEIMNRNTTIQSKDVQAARNKIEKAGTPEEKNAAYAEYVKAFGEMFVNDNLANKALDKAIESIENDADKFFDNGKEYKEEFGDDIKEFATELTGIYEEVEFVLTNMSISGPGESENPELAEMMNDTREMFDQVFKSDKKTQVELFDSISSLSSDGMDGNNVKSAVGDIRNTLVYAKQVLAFTRLKHLIEFKVASAVGKVSDLTGKLNKLMDEAFKGLDPAEFLEGIHNDSYDTSYMAFLMKNDLQKMAEKSGVISKTMRTKIKRSLKRFKMAPKPGSVKDSNPKHKYFYNSRKDRWFWVTNDEPTKKHWAPFDKEANTGKYIKFADGKWYSIAPIYNGKEVEIKTDSETKPAKM